MKKITYEEKACYLIQDFDQELVIEADTGSIIRMVSRFSGEQTTTIEYSREFDTVQNSDVIKPEI